MKLVKRSAFGWPTHPNVGTGPCKNGMVVHYNDEPPMHFADKPHSACVNYWKDTRKFHMSGRGWSDIGYSFGICAHGYVLEGRGFGYQQAAQPGGNSTWTSGTFMSGAGEYPTPVQLQAWRDLRAWLRSKGVASRIKGHKDFISTSCPGTTLYKLVTNTKSPLYGKGSGTSDWMEVMVNKLPTLGKGDRGEHVQSAQGLLRARSHPEVEMDGVFDEEMENAVKAVQRWGGVDDDGIIGQNTWPVLLRVH